jgi:hypothetical protein
MPPMRKEEHGHSWASLVEAIMERTPCFWIVLGLVGLVFFATMRCLIGTNSS